MPSFKFRKSQISLFLILGLIILTSALIAFSLLSKKEQIPKLIDSSSVKTFVDDCLSLTSKKGIDRVLIQGGTYQRGTLMEGPRIHKLAKPLSDTGEKRIARTEAQFSIEGVERSVENYLHDSFGSCIKSFSSLPYQIESGNFTISTLANEGEIIVNLEYPIKIGTSQNSVSLSSFSHQEKLPLGDLITITGEIIDYSVKRNAIPTEKIGNLSIENDLNLSIVAIEEGAQVENFIFLFGLKNDRHKVAFDIHYDWYR